MPRETSVSVLVLVRPLVNGRIPVGDLVVLEPQRDLVLGRVGRVAGIRFRKTFESERRGHNSILAAKNSHFSESKL